MEVFPAAAGRLFFSCTVTVCPSVTISVGPGICICGQAGAGPVPPCTCPGRKPAGAPSQP